MNYFTFKEAQDWLARRKDQKSKYGYKGAYATKSGKGVVTIKITIDGTSFVLSRLIWSAFNGKNIPSGMIIDHIDGRPENNSPDNLRLSSYSTNAWNKAKQKNNKTGITGVCCKKGRWEATFGRGVRRSFNNLFDAACFRISLENKSLSITERHGK